MMGRRSAALLCVLLGHALVIFLFTLRAPAERAPAEDSFEPEPIHIYLQPLPDEAVPTEPASTEPAITPREPVRVPPPAAAVDAGAAPAPPAAITAPENVDWPLEGKKAAARVLAAEAEAERIAKMFSGPAGTWASLTPRERSRLKKFRWKPGVEGLEVDSNGNTIYHINENCVLVNMSFIGCALGKVPAYGDLFKEMREYFDEQRLPETGQGNGR